MVLSYFDMTLPDYIFTDVHKTEIGAILRQEKGFENLKPVAIASRCTNQANKNYAQLDLEAIFYFADFVHTCMVHQIKL